MNRIDRLTGMILLLQNHRVITAEQVAAHFEISVRTVYRDLVALGEAGVPIVAEAGVGYSLMRGYHIPPVMFTENEAAALFMSGEVTEQVADQSLRTSLRSALLKVRSVLPRERREYLNRLKPFLSVWLHADRSTGQETDSVMPLQQAVVRQWCVRLDYDTGGRGEMSARVVEPLGLIFYSRQWHLIGFCRLRCDFRDFRLDRVKKWEVLAEQFRGHEEFSLKDFLADAINRHELVPVVASFHPRAVERVQREMQCTTVCSAQSREGWASLEMLAYSLDRHAAWLLSFGIDVVVIEPAELRQKIKALAQSVATSYDESLG